MLSAAPWWCSWAVSCQHAPPLPKPRKEARACVRSGSATGNPTSCARPAKTVASKTRPLSLKAGTREARTGRPATNETARPPTDWTLERAPSRMRAWRPSQASMADSKPPWVEISTAARGPETPVRTAIATMARRRTSSTKQRSKTREARPVTVERQPATPTAVTTAKPVRRRCSTSEARAGATASARAATVQHRMACAATFHAILSVWPVPAARRSTRTVCAHRSRRPPTPTWSAPPRTHPPAACPARAVTAPPSRQLACCMISKPSASPATVPARACSPPRTVVPTGRAGPYRSLASAHPTLAPTTD